MVTLNTFFPGDPYTWTKVSGKPARLDYICASSELLAATRWAGVRKDIDVRVGSAGLLLQMCTFRLESREKTGESNQHPLTATLFMTNKVLNFQNRLEHVVLRDDLEIEPLCSALTAEVANAAIDCFRTCRDVPRKDWISGHSWVAHQVGSKSSYRLAQCASECQWHETGCRLHWLEVHRYWGS